MTGTASASRSSATYLRKGGMARGGSEQESGRKGRNVGTRAVTGLIDPTGIRGGACRGLRRGVETVTHRRRGAAGDRVMADVRSRSPSLLGARSPIAPDALRVFKFFWLFWPAFEMATRCVKCSYRLTESHTKCATHFRTVHAVTHTCQTRETWMTTICKISEVSQRAPHETLDSPASPITPVASATAPGWAGVGLPRVHASRAANGVASEVTKRHRAPQS